MMGKAWLVMTAAGLATTVVGLVMTVVVEAVCKGFYTCT
jgi:hypothetical protein